MQQTRREALGRLAAVLAGGGCLTGSGHAVAADDSPALTVDARIRRAALRAELSQLFTGTTAAEFQAWHTEFRATLNQLLGPTAPPAEWTVSEEQRTELLDHTRLELLLSSGEEDPVPVYLLLPKQSQPAESSAAPGKARQPLPAVVCVHGHGDHGHHPVAGRRDLAGVEKAIAGANYDYGLQFVRRGYVVAAPCLTPFGQRLAGVRSKQMDPCAVSFIRLQALGRLLIGQNVRDVRWCVDLLQSRPEVDGNRIGCAGLSYGGRITMLTTAVEDRIKVAAVSGALNLLQERITHRYSCGAQIIPGLLQYGDFPEIGSLIAPRPAVWEVGAKDGLVVAGWDQKFRDRLGRTYSAAGAADQLQFDDFEGGHRWNGQLAFPLFDKVLKAGR
ncbi:MAG: acetylxylan esterase [Planctomycetaceae bacterium]|nr:acetylxylan esterase [Planctomycetaceae bacterium]